jgi:hypothetical protein
MPKGPGVLALLIGGKKPPVISSKKTKEQPRGTSRDDLRSAARDFANAENDDARVDALLAFQDLSRDYERE